MKNDVLIPGGCSTYSKQQDLHPVNYPNYIQEAYGSYLYDQDGGKWLDYISSLMAVSLGNADSDVNAEVVKQVALGSIFSLRTSLEGDLAELLVDMIPSLEMVKFFKSGSDATSAAIRLSRAVTGRRLVLKYGYHGWHDWAVSDSSKSHGVNTDPQHEKTIVGFSCSQILSMLDEHQVAALILEPNTTFSEMGYDLEFLRALRDSCTATSTVLIFDEICSGFRSDLGGIQALAGVFPDLTCLGKAMGNGYPIAVLGGTRNLMGEFSKVFCSGTFASENIGLAASLATLRKMKKTDFPNQINKLGSELCSFINNCLEHFEIPTRLIGPSWWPTFKHPEADPLSAIIWRHSLANYNILVGSRLNLTLSHVQTVSDFQDRITRAVSTHKNMRAHLNTLYGKHPAKGTLVR